ncbi:hypothetical protein SKAU_G00195020 [Synaphobranchus kaupii]|uniref:Uncharacterized protein n=1 Tax=Synaphobranchus kaupii TaxID=118154 RepID=A0A9Q1IXM5_SYNKA|nr:hypothetical protein SKAU_G00195020 [Synaphobranchus kaupii]
MAARVDAATPLCPDRAVFCSFSKCLSESFSSSSRLSTPEYKYSRQALLDICRSQLYNTLDTAQTETTKELGLLRRPATTPDSTATPPPERRRRKRCERKQKRGKRGGQNNTHPQKTPPPPHDQALCLSAASVKRTLSTINTRKATGADALSGWSLSGCTVIHVYLQWGTLDPVMVPAQLSFQLDG